MLLLKQVREEPMSIADRYQSYAEAFEETYKDDDWTRIEPFFTEDAVYEAAPEEDARGAVAPPCWQNLRGAWTPSIAKWTVVRSTCKHR